MDDGALIQYKNVEIHQQELCVLSLSLIHI